MPHYWLTTYQSNLLSTAVYQFHSFRETYIAKLHQLNHSGPLKKNVNNQNLNFIGQTKATVETNKETIELPLIITKAKTALLMGLDWMQRLKINLT